MPQRFAPRSNYLAHRYGVIHDLRAAHEQIKMLRGNHEAEVARLMAIIRMKDDALRREQEARNQLDLYLQKWVLENPEVKHE